MEISRDIILNSFLVENRRRPGANGRGHPGAGIPSRRRRIDSNHLSRGAHHQGNAGILELPKLQTFAHSCETFSMNCVADSGGHSANCKFAFFRAGCAARNGCRRPRWSGPDQLARPVGTRQDRQMSRRRRQVRQSFINEQHPLAAMNRLLATALAKGIDSLRTVRV